MPVIIWWILADLKFMNSNAKKQYYGLNRMDSNDWEKVQEWKSRMLTTVTYGKRVRCNGGVDPDKST